MSSIKRKSESPKAEEEEEANKKAKAASSSCCTECQHIVEEVFEVDGELICVECATTCNDCGEFQSNLVFSEKYSDRLCKDCIDQREEREEAAAEDEEEEECSTCHETNADCIYFNNESEPICPTCLKTCTVCGEMGEVDLDMDENSGDECIRVCAKCDRTCDHCEEVVAANEPLLKEVSIVTLGSIRLCGKCQATCDVCSAADCKSIATNPLIGTRMCPECAKHCRTCHKVINSELDPHDTVMECKRCMHAKLDGQLKSVFASVREEAAAAAAANQ